VRSGRVSIRSFLQPKGASRGLRLFTWVCGFGRAQKAIWSPRSFRNNRSPNSGGWAALFRISSCKRVERASLKSINPGSFSSRRSDSAARASWKNQVLCDWERTTTAEGSSSRRSTFPRANFRKIYWLSGDYQHIANPGFNAARGPATSSP
jgi:hypothetical protein